MKIKFALCAILLAGAFTINAGDKPKAADKPKADPEAAFKKKDENSDGKISKEEFVGKKDGEAKTKAEASFTAKDTDKDGFLSKEEFTAVPVHAKKAK
ncbi:MAG: EF-hand domain-containing protein [Verrucomicrobia bacterium]|nr:EF-hand domain-containing protein [Verrucomicrobiota bacterium]